MIMSTVCPCQLVRYVIKIVTIVGGKVIIVLAGLFVQLHKVPKQSRFCHLAWGGLLNREEFWCEWRNVR